MKLSWLWIGLIPLLYLPNFLGANTGYGTLEVSDFFIVPLLAILLVIPKKRTQQIYARFIVIPGLAFVVWAMLGIFLIFLLYSYNDVTNIVTYSFLKVSKFCLYAVTPLVISSRLVSPTIRQDFNWAYLGCCLFLSLGVVVESRIFTGSTVWEKQTAFKSLNLISTVMAMLIVYLSAILLEGTGTAKWRLACKLSMVSILLGFSLTEGRGGWIAAICGLVYLGYKRGILRTKTLGTIGVASIASVGLYFTNPEFRKQVDMTLFPEKRYEAEKHTIFGIDDGYRLGEWERQFRHFSEHFVFGSGFYHRKGETKLSGSGSHNFWLQMFLETGVVGGCLMLFIFIRMWKHAHSAIAEEHKLKLGLSSALVTAFIGGLSGEYFYGGLGLFTILLIYAPLGSLSIKQKVLLPENEEVEDTSARANVM